MSGIGRTTPIGTRTPWSFVKQNEGVGGFSPHNGVRCSSSAAGSQPGTVCSFNKTKNATVTPSAATSRSSPGDLNVSTSLRRGALHGAEIASSTHTSAAGGLAPERAARPAKSPFMCRRFLGWPAERGIFRLEREISLRQPAAIPFRFWDSPSFPKPGMQDPAPANSTASPRALFSWMDRCV